MRQMFPEAEKVQIAKPLDTMFVVLSYGPHENRVVAEGETINELYHDAQEFKRLMNMSTREWFVEEFGVNPEEFGEDDQLQFEQNL